MASNSRTVELSVANSIEAVSTTSLLVEYRLPVFEELVSRSLIVCTIHPSWQIE